MHNSVVVLIGERRRRMASALLLASSLFLGGNLFAGPESYVEPGSLRLSHALTLESVVHRLQPGWNVSKNGLNKTYSQNGKEGRPWKTQWGQRLLTEAAARVTPDVFGRVLFEAQGEYADRFWRPVTIEHDQKKNDNPVFLRQAEGSIDRDNWYLHGFLGVGHNDWQAYGDFFALYPESFPDDDYLGSSGSFGIYPDSWKQDLFLNISRRHAPRGGEFGFNASGLEGAVAYGNELAWGYSESIYGRVRIPISNTALSLVVKKEDVPYSIKDGGEDKEAYALSWAGSSEAGDRADIGVLYQPFRLNRGYFEEKEVSAGQGVGGTNVDFQEKETGRSDALAGRIRLERRQPLWDRIWIGVLDVTHAGVLAGNKDEIGALLGTDITPLFRGSVQYTYRKPVVGPQPFIFEGTPENMGAILSAPRGPDDPFTVDWSNRESVSVLTTLSFDPTPGSNLFRYDPTKLFAYNLNPDENAPVAFAVQHHMTDYRTTTDRQYYFDVNGKLVWEPAGHSGAWPSDGFLHEGRLLAVGSYGTWGWMLGVAGGQSPALLGSAYSNDTAREKPITEYYSVEGKLSLRPLVFWGHYGSGVWGPEKTTHPAFGFAFRRLYGGGVTYNITVNTNVDLSYLAARSDHDFFFGEDLGSFDELRILFTHKFGFIFQFQESSRPGYRAR